MPKASTVSDCFCLWHSQPVSLIYSLQNAQKPIPKVHSTVMIRKSSSNCLFKGKSISRYIVTCFISYLCLLAVLFTDAKAHLSHSRISRTKTQQCTGWPQYHKHAGISHLYGRAEVRFYVQSQLAPKRAGGRKDYSGKEQDLGLALKKSPAKDFSSRKNSKFGSSISPVRKTTACRAKSNSSVAGEPLGV